MRNAEDKNTTMEQKSVPKNQFPIPKINAKKTETQNKIYRKTYKSALWYKASYMKIDLK